MKKVALFFGSFNPIHIGHLMIADQLRQQQMLDQIWFVVSPQNPFKEKKSLLAEHHRLAMVKEAIDDHLYFRAEDIEFSMPQPSYTIDTLVRLKEKHPGIDFSIILGEDNWAGFEKWKNYDQILSKYKIFIYPRSGSRKDLRIPHKNVIFCENLPILDLSASMIRSYIQQGLSIQYLVTDKVRRYIEEMHFYK